MERKNLVGVTFNRWVVLEEVDSKRTTGRTRSYVQRQFSCKCECGNIKTISASNLTTGASKSCGCLQKEKARIQIKKIKTQPGELNPNWKGGIRKKYKRKRNINNIRDNDEYILWRIYVNKKYNYTCQICSSRKFPIAHHIEGFSYNNELRYDINNGITLCKSCHSNFHKTFGFGNNTREQLEQFINIK